MAIKGTGSSNILRRKKRALETMTAAEFKAAFGETKTQFKSSLPNKMLRNKMTANRGGLSKKKKR